LKEEVALLSDERALSLIQSAARNVDPLLQAAATEGLGHKYSNINIQGKSQTGDVFSSDWKGNPSKRPHVYNGIEVRANGKALVGNKYEGKDFWED
jgi:hypothetical protein